MRLCDIEGCGRKHKGRGLCAHHYMRQYHLDRAEERAASSRAYYQANREQILEAHRAYYVKNRDAKLAYGLQKKYGLSVADLEKLLNRQGRRCAVCTTPFTDKKVPCVDHCHETGHIRGALCHSCNRGIGLLGDKPEVLGRAIEYLGRGRR